MGVLLKYYFESHKFIQMFKPEITYHYGIKT